MDGFLLLSGMLTLVHGTPHIEIVKRTKFPSSSCEPVANKSMCLYGDVGRCASPLLYHYQAKFLIVHDMNPQGSS